MDQVGGKDFLVGPVLIPEKAAFNAGRRVSRGHSHTR
jgi:hypothetical protein